MDLQPAFINPWIQTDQAFALSSPSTGALLAHMADCTAEHARLAAEGAGRAFASWPTTTAHHRAGLLLGQKEGPWGIAEDQGIKFISMGLA